MYSVMKFVDGRFVGVVVRGVAEDNVRRVVAAFNRAGRTEYCGVKMT